MAWSSHWSFIPVFSTRFVKSNHVLDSNFVSKDFEFKYSIPRAHRTRIAWNCSSDSPLCSRKSFLKLAAALLITTASSPTDNALAVCGQPDPFWAHYVNWQEDDVQVDGRRVHFRVLGDFRKEKKAHIFPVLCLGDIGLSMDDLEPLELLAKSDRRVILIDHLGTGESEKLENAPETLSRAELAKLAAEETRAVLENVTFVTPERTVHAFCSGFGMEVAASLASGSMSNVPEGSTSKNIRFASIIVEPSIARRSLPSESLPICAVDAVKRGDSRLLHMHTVASQDSNSSSKSGSASFRKLASSYPTLCLVSKLNAAPAYESVPAERKYIPGPIGLPHLDDNETVLQEVDDFMVKHDRLQ